MPTAASPLVIAFIPARGGSKGVPRKNARKLGNIPLLAYTVAVASQVKAIDRIVVSTEDEELAAIAKEFGGEVPFLRPEHLAQDDSNLNEVLNYTHARLKTIWDFPERYILATMMPTSPFRNAQELEFLLTKAKNDFHVHTVSSICHSCHSLFSLTDSNLLQPILPGQKKLQKFYRNNGYCLATNWGSPAALPTYIHEISNPISLIDIDHWEDFFLAEAIIRRNLFDFGIDAL